MILRRAAAGGLWQSHSPGAGGAIHLPRENETGKGVPGGSPPGTVSLVPGE